MLVTPHKRNDRSVLVFKSAMANNSAVRATQIVSRHPTGKIRVSFVKFHFD
jgi:hypothetical protein